MNILMLTNTYKPILGGLERSVETFCAGFRRRGHNVLIVTPRMKDAREDEDCVVRVPAIQNFNHTDFSVELPVSLMLASRLKQFAPDIVHSHHPFFIGDTALRISAQLKIPIVFTHHTLYEEHTHYFPVRAAAAKTRSFVIELSTGYANLCDLVFAPSKTIRDLLRERGVRRPIVVNPTGIYAEHFADGSGSSFREDIGIPGDAFVIGYAGRIAEEKNIMFVCRAAAEYMDRDPRSVFLAIGYGPLFEDAVDYFKKRGRAGRAYFAGPLHGEDLVNGYAAMDVYAFASKSETQGIVILEAMAAGVPVVALDTPVVAEVIKDGVSGFLVKEDEQDFCRAFAGIKAMDISGKRVIKDMARQVAGKFSVEDSIERALRVYQRVIDKGYIYRDAKDSRWRSAIRQIKAEFEIIENVMRAAQSAVKEEV